MVTKSLSRAQDLNDCIFFQALCSPRGLEVASGFNSFKSQVFEVMDFSSHGFSKCIQALQTFKVDDRRFVSRTSGLWVSWAVGLFRIVVVDDGGGCCGRDRDACGR